MQISTSRRPRSARRPPTPSFTRTPALALGALLAATVHAQIPRDKDSLWNAQLAGDALTPHGDIGLVLCTFNFDERRLGNFEDTPMHWERLTGPGLPAYARGRFDEDLGHDAPPSFRLNLVGVGNNVGYEYTRNDLRIEPGSDYRISAWVRAAGLQHARAFLAAFAVDESGRPIPGSHQVSNLLGSAEAPVQPWQRAIINLSLDDPRAAYLRLQLWVMQSYVWRDEPRRSVDPIVLQDVRADVWFDDISVRKLPRVRLRMNDPAGLVEVGRQAALFFDLVNVSDDDLAFQLAIVGEDGKVCWTETHPVSASASTTLECAVPALPPGRYLARGSLLADDEVVLSRELGFVRLAPLRPRNPTEQSFGIDLGLWSGGEADGLQRFFADLHCRLAEVAVPLLMDPELPQNRAHIGQLCELLRSLTGQRIDAVAALVASTAPRESGRAISLRAAIAGEPRWRERSAPILSAFAGVVTTWQLGDERVELSADGDWSPAAIEELRSQVTRFVSVPDLVIPRSLMDPAPSAQDTISVYVSPMLPAPALAQQFSFLAAPSPARRWLHVAADERGGLSRDAVLADLALRIVLARAFEPDRVFVSAPFELSVTAGQPHWQPSEGYLVVRTLLHYLTGARPVGALRPDRDSVALLFRDAPDSSRGFLVAWTWRSDNDAALDLYLGDQPTLVELNGVAQPLAPRSGRTHVRLRSAPVIIDDVDVPVVQLQASFSFEPNYVEVHADAQAPTVRFRNDFGQPASGTIQVGAPNGWQVVPATIEFALDRGQTFERKIDLRVPPRQVATVQSIPVRVAFQSPRAVDLRFDVPFTVGLRDVRVNTEAHWRGLDLIVEQTVQNLSDQVISFTAFCEAPAQARLDGAFLRLKPGDRRSQTYLFSEVRGLAGLTARCGIQEIRGQRRLDQLVKIPE